MRPTQRIHCVYSYFVRSKPLCQFVKLFPAIFFFSIPASTRVFFLCIYMIFEIQRIWVSDSVKTRGDKKNPRDSNSDKKGRKASIWQMCPDIWDLLLFPGCPVPYLHYLLIYSLSILYYPAISLQQNKKELKTTPTAPVSVWSNHLATFFSPCFNVLHILSWSLLFIHRFIPLNPPSPSVLLIFLSPRLSHFIRLLLHFPLPSIIMIPRLLRILISPSPICEIDISGLVLFPHRRPRRGLAVLTLKVFNWSSLQHSFWVPHWSEAFFH